MMASSLLESSSGPAHIPEHLILDYDFRGDPRHAPDLHRGIATLLGGPSLIYTPRNGGHWVATKKNVVMEIMRDPELFSSRNSNIPAPITPIELKFPLELDAPLHTKWRKHLTPLLAAGVIKKLADSTASIATDLIDGFIADGECEFVEALAVPMPATVFMEIMGLPKSDFPRFRGWVNQVLHSSDTAEKGRIYLQIVTYLEELVLQRRKQPEDDLISAMALAEIDGELAPLAAARSMCLMLFLGGLDTTTNAMGFVINHLAQHPSDRQQLVDDPSLIERAIEEMLRRYSFSTGVRTVTRDAELAGIHLREGDLILLYTSMAGLDETEVANPFVVDFNRPASNHLSFGAGPHFCPGSHLARLGLKTFVTQWLSRIPDFSLKQSTVPVYRAGSVLGIDRLELAWPTT